MSNALITKAFEFDTGSSVTKIVLVKLCDNASDEGFCWPSQDKIAAHCNLTKKSVITHINKLIDMGLLKKTNRFQDNKQKSNMYEISFRGESHDMGVNLTTNRGESHDQQGCTTFTQNPKENPKEEPLWLSKAKPEYLDFCKEYYEMLEFHGKINKNTQWKTKTWYTAVRLMVEADNISFSEVQNSILFLSKALSDKYCPQVWSVPSLRDKWINLREYAFRSNGSGISKPKQDMKNWTGL